MNIHPRTLRVLALLAIAACFLIGAVRAARVQSESGGPRFTAVSPRYQLVSTGPQTSAPQQPAETLAGGPYRLTGGVAAPPAVDPRWPTGGRYRLEPDALGGGTPCCCFFLPCVQRTTP